MSVDPLTGERSPIEEIPGLYSTTNGISAFDPERSELYTLSMFDDDSQRLITFDAFTGDRGPSPVANPGLVIEAIGGGRVAGIRMGGVGFDFVATQLNTGVVDLLSAQVAMLGRPRQGTSALDTELGRYYLLTRSDDGSDRSRLVTIESGTGAVLHDVITDVPLWDLEVERNGRLVATTNDTALASLRGVDPTNGTTSEIASLPAPIVNVDSAVDADSRTFYYGSVESDGDGFLPSPSTSETARIEWFRSPSNSCSSRSVRAARSAGARRPCWTIVKGRILAGSCCEIRRGRVNCRETHPSRRRVGRCPGGSSPRAGGRIRRVDEHPPWRVRPEPARGRASRRRWSPRVGVLTRRANALPAIVGPPTGPYTHPL